MVALGQLSPGEYSEDLRNNIIKMLMTAKEAQTTFISEVYRALPVNCNFTAEQDKLMSHPYIPRCLSLQAGLGFKGRLKRRNLSSAVPWASLQLRHSSVLFAYFFQYNKGGQTESHDPGEFKESQLNYRGPLLIETKDVLRMVLGNTKWTLDFSHFLLNEIFDMADEFEDVYHDPEAFTQKCKEPPLNKLQLQGSPLSHHLHSEKLLLPSPSNPPLKHVARLPPLHLPRPPRRECRLRKRKPRLPRR